MPNYVNFNKFHHINTPLDEDEAMELIRRYSLVMQLRTRGDGSSRSLQEDMAFIADLSDIDRDFALVRMVVLEYDHESEECYAEDVKWYRTKLLLPASLLLAEKFEPSFDDDDDYEEDEDDEDYELEEDEDVED